MKPGARKVLAERAPGFVFLDKCGNGLPAFGTAATAFGFLRRVVAVGHFVAELVQTGRMPRRAVVVGFIISACHSYHLHMK